MFERYTSVLEAAKSSSTELLVYLRAELKQLWFEAYLQMTPRPTNVVTFTHGVFEYLYDDYATLESTSVVSIDETSESRLVAALGVSDPRPVDRRHDDGRLRGWVGPTMKTFGNGWDKGHFIGHSIGGAVDGLEANVFLQRSKVNRGAYRQMEAYCAANPGVFCFSRPLYCDPSSRPTQVEFGVLRPDRSWWIQVFENS